MFSPNPNAEAIANNYDLLTLILARLPVKSLLRFKSVSKGWYSLISDPAFSRRVFPDQVSGLILHKNYKVEFVPLPDKSITNKAPSLTFLNRFIIRQSCHGLLLCARISPFFSGSLEVCGIYNPTMEEFVELPPPSNQHPISGFSLAFDPTKSPHYKVVFVGALDPEVDLFWEEDCTSFQIEIYSSQTRSWRLFGNPFTADVFTPFHGEDFWNGSIHWLNKHNVDVSLYFNVEEEKLGKLPMLSIPERARIGYFGASGDHLHLILLHQLYPTQFDIYEMERDYAGWFVKYRVDLDAITVAFPDMIIRYFGRDCYKYATFCVVEEANEEDSYMVLHIPGKVIQYNLKDGSFKMIYELDPENNDHHEGFHLYRSPLKYFVAYQYIPSRPSV